MNTEMDADAWVRWSAQVEKRLRKVERFACSDSPITRAVGQALGETQREFDDKIADLEARTTDAVVEVRRALGLDRPRHRVRANTGRSW
jgi:hypothetical protein